MATSQQNLNKRICLVCSAQKPCMSETDLKPGDPGIPCTFDPPIPADMSEQDVSTERPWGYSSRLTWSENHRGFSLTAGHYRIGMMYPMDPNGKEGKANAALIVKAVNHHDEVVEALEKVVYELGADDLSGEPHWLDDIRTILKKVRP